MKTLSLRLRFLAAWVLTAAFLLCGNFTLQHWYSLWNGGSFIQSSPCLQLMSYKVDQVTSLGELLCREEYDTLPFLESELAGQLSFELMPQNTNFRFSLHTADGKRICDNTGGQHVSDVADGVTLFTFMTSFTVPGSDVILREESGGIVADADSPSVEEDGGVTIVRQSLVLEYGLAKTLTAADEFADAAADFSRVLALLPAIALAALVFLIGAAAATVFFCLGLRKTDYALKKPPFDLLLAILCLAALFFYDLAQPALRVFLAAPWQTAPLLATAVFDGAQAALWLVGLAAFVYQWRRGLWKNCLIYRWCAALGRKLRAAWSGLRLSRRPAVAFFIYLACTMLLGLLLYMSLFDGGEVWLFLLLFVLFQWASLRLSLRMERDRQAVIAETVEREIRAQRFQAELITNVSHDLRSPLTSLINYVDLLKKAGPNAPEAGEYLDVLDRKSQRLKKLTDDLIEASKASSGVLPVNLEVLGLKELAQQAAAEYDDRFQTAGLTLVMDGPEEDVMVVADGRHLWRVLDNLLSNCAKYSLSGSRVYLAVARTETAGVIAVKNVSAESLNIPADELMSRFVRGDHSRTDGGSGLGLSIAESLTKLQHGTFSLDIDGDLFKASVSLPLAPDPSDNVLPAPGPKEDAAHE